MPVYGVSVPTNLLVAPYGTTGEWKMYDALGVHTSGFLWEAEPVPLDFFESAAFDRGFYSVAYEQSGSARINVYKTDLKTGLTELVHYVGAYGGADSLDAVSITSTPDGDSVLFIWTTSADGWLLHMEKSTNYGATWSSVSRPTFAGLDNPFYAPMWRIAKYPTWLFRATSADTSQIYKSFDDGLTWQPNINIPPGTYCNSRMPRKFLNYETILLEAPQDETYYPGEASRIYALNLETNAITEYLIADDEGYYIGYNALHRSFGSICRMNSQPPAMTESHGPRDDPAILSTELGLITNSEAAALVALTKTEWQDIKDCYGFPMPQVLGGTKANSYLCFNRNGTIGVVMPKIPGNPWIDFWFNTGDEKLYGVEVPAAGDYASAVPATWALNDINTEVTTGQVWATPTGGTTTIYNTSHFDRGFYTLTKEVDGLGFIYRVWKTDVFAAPYSEVIYEIPYELYSARSLICSKDGQEILISFTTVGGGGSAPSAIFRSFNGGVDFSTQAGSVANWHRYDGSTENLFTLWTAGDADDLTRSSSFGVTRNDFNLPYELLSRIPSKPTFYYGRKAIQTSRVPSVFDDIVWSVADLSNGVVVGTTPIAMNAGSATTPLRFHWLSFGCCNLPPSTGNYAQTANAPVITTASETIYYNNRTGIFDGTLQLVKDCYGAPMSKTYGFCRGASTLVFNETGSIGLAPNIDGAFLIYLSPDYSQFFTSFVKSVETNLRPE